MKRTSGETILCLNSGSSSLKFALYDVRGTGGAEEEIVRGGIEGIGGREARLWLRSGRGEPVADLSVQIPGHAEAVHYLFDTLQAQGSALPLPSAAGNRVVHGGPYFDRPVLIDRKVIETLKGLVPLAPLHLPSEIICIEATQARFPDLPQVACFDTAFHRSMPEVAQRFPLPRSLWEEGIRRYGFHGLSFEYVVSVLGEAAQGRVVIAHLGNGASMAAVREGRCLETTMGFSPTGGFMMGTRSGDLDPGVLVYLMREKGYDAEKIAHLVDHEAGLLGVSGSSHEMKVLLEKRHVDPRAAQAVEMFCYHLRKHLGALAALLGGVDTLVFTGRIGERAAPIRAEVCNGLEHLGIRIDPVLNETHAETISLPGSPCSVRVIPTSEELIIARQTYRVIAGTQANPCA